MKAMQDAGKNDKDVIRDLMEKMMEEGKGESQGKAWQNAEAVADEMSAWVRDMKEMVLGGMTKDGRAFTTTQQVSVLR